MTVADDLSEMPKLCLFRCRHQFSGWPDLKSGVMIITSRYMRAPNVLGAIRGIHSASYRSSGSIVYQVRTARSRVILVLIVISLIYVVLSNHRI